MNGMEVKVVQAVRQAGMEERVIYSSFDHYCLRRSIMWRLLPKRAFFMMPVCISRGIMPRRCRPTALHPHYVSLFEPLIVDQAHREGLEVNTWTVNDSALVRTLGLKGVDGIITNDPDMALTALREADCLD